jgi:hypothetical protein
MRLLAIGGFIAALTTGLLMALSCSRSELPIWDYERVPVACVQGDFPLSRAYPTVMFVLDRSTSMETEMGNRLQSENRWQALGRALETALPAIDSNVQVGALLFPSTASSQSCSVSSSANLVPKRGNVAQLVSLMRNTSPGGATPTAAALDSAASLLLSTRASNSARALVLATDGGPDCNESLPARGCRCANANGLCNSATRCLDDVRTIERISTYAARGLPTFVIGIQSEGDTAFSDVLDAMAVAGDRPQSNAAQKYYAARSEAELEAALDTISRVIGTCLYLTSSVPNAGGTIQLVLDGVVLSEELWRWHDRNNGEIELHPGVCDQVLAEEDPKLMARVTCADE